MRFWKLGLLAFLLGGACIDDGAKKPSPDTTASNDTSSPDGDTSSPDGDTSSTPDGDSTSPDGDSSTPPVERPAFFPDRTANPDETLTIPALANPVRIIYDNRGVPHIYASSTTDAAFAQGFVTARDRIFQMHTLRSAARGRLAEFSGASALAGDLLLRLLHLDATAQKMADNTRQNDPDLYATLEAYAAGVNHFLARARDGKETLPPELRIFGVGIVDDWTPRDTMAIARLQTWDLSFGGIVDEYALWRTIASLKTKFDATSPLYGIEKDIANFEPTAKVATLSPDEDKADRAPRAFDLSAALSQPIFTDPGALRWANQVADGMDALKTLPHRLFSGGDPDGVAGSNNWVVSGAHTASGYPLLANDTHLALRNPAVFYQVHVSTATAGGDLDVLGVNFAGAPGITLGQNAHAAWGGTVVYSDVTDMYIEDLNADRTAVRYDNQDVALVEREETFRFVKPASAATCIDAAPNYRGLKHSERMEDTTCVLTITFLEVPHHGPIIPWSFWKDGSNVEHAISWKWTGFEPTDDLGAIWRLNFIKNYNDFKTALDRFGVGAQNWIYGGVDGDIGWYPSHRVPIRKHLASGDTTSPPFLPMPGNTSDTNWEATFLPRSEIPQAHNPDKGYLITANADPTGISFDNNPFNDGPYFGYTWDVGYRVARITERLSGLIAQGKKLTVADMQAIQGDHRSNLGAELVPAILKAIDDHAADPTVASLLTDGVNSAIALLRGWAALDYEAASGVGEPDNSPAAKAAAATAVFNVFLPIVMQKAFGDEGGLGLNELGLSMQGRFLRRVFVAPETMVTTAEGAEDTVLWDDVTTPNVTETRAEIIVRSLAQAVAFLSDSTKVGPSVGGGFGSSDPNTWRWGALHTVKLKHNVSESMDIPDHATLPNGFPRPGDNFTVDACNPGLTDTYFGFSSGAAIRNVFHLTDTVSFHGVIPGGQRENPLQTTHYNDEALLWSKNEAPPILFAVTDVVQVKERTLDLMK